MHKLLLLGVAGGLGSLTRYGVAGAVQRLAGTSFPLGTFAVNMLGCLLFGAIWGFLENRADLAPLRLYALTGFMGAFTTFSTFGFESAQLVTHAQWTWAVANLVGQNALGVSLVILGLAAGRLL